MTYSGINLIGDLTTDIGLSEATRMKVNALLQAGIPLSYIEIPYAFGGKTKHLPPQLEAIPRGHQYPVNLLFYNFRDLAERITPEAFLELTRGHYTIAYWYWELPGIPAGSLPAFDWVDEIWVASRFVQQTMQVVTAAPVHVLPPPIIVPTSDRVSRARFGIPDDRYVFFFSFSAASSIGRKNPFAVVAAFQKAFGKSGTDGPLLVIKAQHLDLFPGAKDQLQQALDTVGGLLLDQAYSRQEVNDLLACIDAYVSLHRSEGFGLGMAEAMYLGKPVIGTAYSSNLDFMNGDNSLLVDYKLREIAVDDHQYQPFFREFYEPGYLWAEPDIDHAAALMHQLYQDPAQGRATGARAAEYMRQAHSAEQFVSRVKARLDALETTHYQLLEKHIHTIPAPVRTLTHRFNRPLNHTIGWHPVEVDEHGTTYQWTAAAQAFIFLSLDIAGDAVFRCTVYNPGAGFSLSVNEQPVTLVPVTDHQLEGIIPAAVLHLSPGRSKITISCPSLTNRDNQQVGVALSRLEIYPADLHERHIFEPLLDAHHTEAIIRKSQALHRELERRRLQERQHRVKAIPLLGAVVTLLIRIRNLGHMTRLHHELFENLIAYETLLAQQQAIIAARLATLENHEHPG